MKSPVVWVELRGNRQCLRADTAGGVMWLDEASQIRNGIRTAGAQEDERRSTSVAVVVADAVARHFPAKSASPKFEILSVRAICAFEDLAHLYGCFESRRFQRFRAFLTIFN